MAARSPLAKNKLDAFAARLRKARLDAGCASMEAGARRAKTVSSVYTRHERAQLMATVMMIERYAKAFGVSPCWLAFGEPLGTGKPWAQRIKAKGRNWRSKYV